MDYLDPRKRFRDEAMLLTGYVLIAMALSMITIILLNVASGFWLDKNGVVVQNGLTFFSSHPHPASIYVDGQLKSVKTNTRLVLKEGIYQIRLTRDGYQDWQRTIELAGGKVQHYDYPFLFPSKLVTKKFDGLAAAPGLVTQSPDQKWLLVQKPGSLGKFSLYDLKNPLTRPTELDLPTALLSPGSKQSLQLVEWASDNRHVLLKHIYDGKTEFVVVDRAAPAQSLNINQQLSITPALLTLRDKKYDQYYVYDTSSAKLSAISLGSPSLTPVIEQVLAYKTYARDTILYATQNGADKGQVLVNLKIGNTTYLIKRLALSPSYVLDLAKYEGVMYVAAGAAKDNRVYIYQDPVGQLSETRVAVPTQVLRVEGVNYLSFSPNAQFIVAENGARFGVYDIQNEKGFSYKIVDPVDKPQLHASWMDGDRLTFVSGGKLMVFDYDHTNIHTLVAASGSYLPVFDPDYRYLYTISGPKGQVEIDQTALLAPRDL